jgi:hypothetical protein
MTDETPGPKAPEKPKRKRAREKKPPTEWLRTTAMGRQEIVDELVGLPDHYTQDPDGKRKDGKPAKGAGERIPVHPACVKAVLRCIAGWDKPGAEFYRSNENIAHCTGWPVSMVNKANLALKQIGLLKKERGGWDDPSYSELDWDRMQRYRRRYCPKPGLKEKLPTPTDDPDVVDDKQPETTAAEAQPVVASLGNLDPLTGVVLGRFVEAKIFNQQELAKLPALEVDKMIRQVRTPKNEAALRPAILRLDNQQLAKVIWAETNSVGYLRKVLISSMEAGASVAKPEGKRDIEESEQEGKRPREFSLAVAKYFTAQWVNDDDKPDPSSDHLAPLFYEAMMNEPKPNKGIRIGHYIKYAFEKDKYFRGLSSLDQAARTFLKQLPKLIVKYQGQYLDPMEDIWDAMLFAAIWEGKKGGKSTADGKTYWHDGPDSQHLVAILRQPLVGNPGPKKKLYIEYVFEKDPGLRTLPLEKAATTFMKQLPQWIAKYNEELSDPDEEEEDVEEEDDLLISYNEDEDGWMGV